MHTGLSPVCSACLTRCRWRLVILYRLYLFVEFSFWTAIITVVTAPMTFLVDSMMTVLYIIHLATNSIDPSHASAYLGEIDRVCKSIQRTEFVW